MTEEEIAEAMIWWRAIDEERRRALAEGRGGLSAEEQMAGTGAQARTAIVHAASYYVKLDPDGRRSKLEMTGVARWIDPQGAVKVERPGSELGFCGMTRRVQLVTDVA